MLSSLSRGFEAGFVAEQLLQVIGARAVGDLLRKSVLQNAGVSSTALRCVCDLRRTRCTPPVDERDGVYVARCPEFGRPVTVAVELLQRYRFDWPTWAARIRSKNSLAGEGPTLGAGALYVGDGVVAGREFHLAFVAPSCRISTEVIFPGAARRDGKPIVAVLLGEPIQGLPAAACVPAAVLGTDFVTIDCDAIERALDPVSVTMAPTTLRCMLYDREHRKGLAIDDAEYQRLLRPETRKQFGLLIDRLSNRIWRNGRACSTVRDADGRSRQKRLGPLSVSLLADYVRQPGTAMTAKRTRTYRGSSTSEHSASVQLSEVRRSVEGRNFIRSGARADRAAEMHYYFDPGGMAWCLLDPLPTT